MSGIPNVKAFGPNPAVEKRVEPAHSENASRPFPAAVVTAALLKSKSHDATISGPAPRLMTSNAAVAPAARSERVSEKISLTGLPRIPPLLLILLAANWAATDGGTSNGARKP